LRSFAIGVSTMKPVRRAKIPRSHRWIMYISSLESFGIDKLRDVEMRKKYAAGQQP
jgi:hypothetical protein